MIADRIVREFQKFLCQSWGSVERFLQEETTDAEDLRLDWLQVNWEILVEAALCKTPYEILEVYGDGADCNGASSRVWLPDEMPTHKIGCSSPEGSRVFDVLSSTSIELHKFEFGQFVAWDGKYYSFDVPFDHLIIERGNELAIVNATEISFNLEPISDI